MRRIFRSELRVSSFALCIIFRLFHPTERSFPAVLIGAPSAAKLVQGPVRLLVLNTTLCLVSHVPPRVLLHWLLSDLRRFGAVEQDRFALEGGQKCGTKGENRVKGSWRDLGGGHRMFER